MVAGPERHAGGHVSDKTGIQRAKKSLRRHLGEGLLGQAESHQNRHCHLVDEGGGGATGAGAGGSEATIARPHHPP